jgi:glycerophosphoryl diester phosphodiesterase
MNPRGARPLVIAHRGASGYRPEHTLASYALALEMGADFIEPDLVATADGVLICRHENALAVLDDEGRPVAEATTTDVWQRPEFSARLVTKSIDGQPVRGWFSEDFTFAEIQQLRAVERLPQLRPANTAWNGKEPIPSLTDVLALLDAHAARTGHHAGLYPETKHPSYFLLEGRRLDGSPIAIDLSERLIATLVAARFTDPARVFIQSFEIGNLRALRETLMPQAGVQFPLIQLMSARFPPWDSRVAGSAVDWSRKVDFTAIAHYAAGVGPDKTLVMPPSEPSPGKAATDWVAQAHAAGLDVHPWTFRAENAFLPAALRRGDSPTSIGDMASEIEGFLIAGVDGFFSDHPDLLLRALRG